MCPPFGEPEPCPRRPFDYRWGTAARARELRPISDRQRPSLLVIRRRWLAAFSTPVSRSRRGPYQVGTSLLEIPELTPSANAERSGSVTALRPSTRLVIVPTGLALDRGPSALVPRPVEENDPVSRRKGGSTTTGPAGCVGSSARGLVLRSAPARTRWIKVRRVGFDAVRDLLAQGASRFRETAPCERFVPRGHHLGRRHSLTIWLAGVEPLACSGPADGSSSGSAACLSWAGSSHYSPRSPRTKASHPVVTGLRSWRFSAQPRSPPAIPTPPNGAARRREHRCLAAVRSHSLGRFSWACGCGRRGGRGGDRETAAVSSESGAHRMAWSLRNCSARCHVAWCQTAPRPGSS